MAIWFVNAFTKWNERRRASIRAELYDDGYHYVMTMHLYRGVSLPELAKKAYADAICLKRNECSYADGEIAALNNLQRYRDGLTNIINVMPAQYTEG